MVRKIIEIDEKRCNGCGACAEACHEGAIGVVDGKARLLRDDYCDGLGDCLPTCPTGAITFTEREAADYSAEAVKAGKTEQKAGCPGMQARILHTEVKSRTEEAAESCLAQWPVQIKLAPLKAPYFDGANLLIAADCTAYARSDFHSRFMRSRVTLIGCPKLDSVDYTEKLTEILKNNDIRSLTVVHMEVPCCGGIEHAAVEALKKSGRFIPWQVVTIATDGRILD